MPLGPVPLRQAPQQPLACEAPAVRRGRNTNVKVLYDVANNEHGNRIRNTAAQDAYRHIGQQAVQGMGMTCAMPIQRRRPSRMSNSGCTDEVGGRRWGILRHRQKRRTSGPGEDNNSDRHKQYQKQAQVWRQQSECARLVAAMASPTATRPTSTTAQGRAPPTQAGEPHLSRVTSVAAFTSVGTRGALGASTGFATVSITGGFAAFFVFFFFFFFCFVGGGDGDATGVRDARRCSLLSFRSFRSRFPWDAAATR